MSLSIEMTGYITTGRCPHCKVAILSGAYVSQNSAQLRASADQLAALTGKQNRFFLAAHSRILAPSGVKAKVTESGYMQCLNCMKLWYPSISTAAVMRDLAATWRTIQRSAPLSNHPPEAAGARTFYFSTPLRKVDLSGCRLASVTEEKQVEKFLWEQRKRYQNHSGSTVTRELSVTSSIALTVTTDSSKLKSYNAEAGISLLGFASIQGQVQRQLGERYSVALQSSSSVSDKTSVAIKPYSTVEHVIQWKVVTWIGTALLGKTALSFSQPIARVPYQVPVRLTYDDDFVDV